MAAQWHGLDIMRATSTTPQRGTVAMLACTQLQVLWTVVCTVAVQVMHAFPRMQGASNLTRHYQAVLFDASIGVRHHGHRIARRQSGEDISTGIAPAATPPRPMTWATPVADWARTMLGQSVAYSVFAGIKGCCNSWQRFSRFVQTQHLSNLLSGKAPPRPPSIMAQRNPTTYQQAADRARCHFITNRQCIHASALGVGIYDYRSGQGIQLAPTSQRCSRVLQDASDGGHVCAHVVSNGARARPSLVTHNHFMGASRTGARHSSSTTAASVHIIAESGAMRGTREG